jgi:hypothetical protein
MNRIIIVTAKFVGKIAVTGLIGGIVKFNANNNFSFLGKFVGRKTQYTEATNLTEALFIITIFVLANYGVKPDLK